MRNAISSWLLVLAGCNDIEQTPCVPVEELELEVGTVVLQVPDELRVLEGFDLDGRASTDSDAEGCFHADFTSPRLPGVASVDSRLGVVLDTPDFDPNSEYAVAFERGDVAISIAARNSMRGCGAIFVTLDGVESSAGFGDDAEAKFGSILDFPLFVMGTRVVLPLRDARIFVDASATPPRAVLGGGIAEDDFVAAIAPVAPDVDEEVIRHWVFEQSADLDPDPLTCRTWDVFCSTCQQVSASWVLEAAM